MCITELIPALGAPQKLLSASLSALWFGSALWFTFISTPINHRILNKADFIAVQAKLLPVHLAIGLVAPAARLYLRIDSTFAVSDGGLVRAISGALGGDPGPVRSAVGPEPFLNFLLIIAIVCALLQIFVIAPISRRALDVREAGTTTTAKGNGVRRTKVAERAAKTFARWHALSMIVNLGMLKIAFIDVASRV
eukprot:TRINITY_DN3284_c0_g1_i2.p2 TRINITY_DN3284_c0_g1~~TRINITY_DN3284_c0_g1_i2.p2  ORF type:complete len:228 (-),score=79.95 TRINITY_DN3284_c0_g1_i2:109-690(-)